MNTKKKKNSNNILRQSLASVNKSCLVCIFSKKPHRRHAPLNWLLVSGSNLPLDTESKFNVHETFRRHSEGPCPSACNFIKRKL